jgi:dUTP pyrophosphatase
MTHEEIDIYTLVEDTEQLPHYATAEAAGADARAYLKEPMTIRPGESRLIPTGLRFDIPSGYEIQVRPRSGLALKNQMTVLNTPGTIDSDYRGEVGIILINHGKADFVVTPGMRIAQFVLAPVVRARYVQAKELRETSRSQNGFGHTGLN